MGEKRRQKGEECREEMGEKRERKGEEMSRGRWEKRQRIRKGRRDE